MGGYHDDLLLCQPHALLGRHDDVLVVGQHEHDLAGGVVHLPQNGLRGGVHGLAAGYHPVHAQIPEGRRQSVSGAYRQKAVALLGGDLRLLGLLQLRLDGVQIVGALGLAARCQIGGLGPHILDLGQLQRTVLAGPRSEPRRGCRCGRGP